MAIKMNLQKDYLETEATIDPSSNVAEVHDLLRAMKTNARLIVIYNGGGVQAINIEQHTKMSESKSDEVRKLLGISTKIFE